MTTHKVVTYSFHCDRWTAGRRCTSATQAITPFPFGSGVVGARKEARGYGWTFTPGERWSRTIKSWCPNCSG